MKTMLLLTGVVAALLIAGAQNADSGARNAVGAPRPTLTLNTTNNVPAQSSARTAVSNTNTLSPVTAADTIGAASSARAPK